MVAMYRVLEKSFIVDRIVEEGAEVEYTGHPGSNLEPLNDEAHAAKAHYDDVVNPKRIADLQASIPFTNATEAALATLIGEAVAKAMAAQTAALASGDAAVKAVKVKAAGKTNPDKEAAALAEAEAIKAAEAAAAEAAAANAEADTAEEKVAGEFA